MSVNVAIDIANGAAYRSLNISLVSTPKSNPRDHDEVGTYSVLIQNQPSGRGALRQATFKHRYGDDVTILIAKAGAALREKYGHI